MTAPLWSVRPCVSKSDPEPGVHLTRGGEDCESGLMSPNEARALGAELILAAGTSEAQWPDPVGRVLAVLQDAGHLHCGEFAVQTPGTEITCGCGTVIPLEVP